MKQFQAIKPHWYLLAGIVFLSAAHLSFNIDIIGWVASVPFLLYLSLTRGLRSRLLFVLALVVAWTLCCFKIISPPVPYAFSFLFSVPIAFIQLPGYLLWDRFKERRMAFWLFPATMALMEWLQYTFTPFASWGVAAYTQSDSIALMQSVSIFGMPGLSFLIYWVNISIVETILKKNRSLPTFYLPASMLLALVVFGAIRYDLNKSSGKKTITVAAIGTDSEVSGWPLPSKESNDRVKAGLFKRTEAAAESGAVLVVWNEAATFILPEEEPAWRDSLGALAAKLRITLVAPYIIPVSEAPMQYENKYLFFDAQGALAYTYHKHQPVPGEPAENGTEPLKVADTGGTKIGAAICYDYDFPYLAKGFGLLDADIVAVPSSDWRGIDPIHTKMAAFRAVEQGHSILRSTRFGLSAAISPVGEFTAQMSSFDDNDKIMMAHLPAAGITTVYSLIGDVFVYGCIAFIAFFLFRNRFTAGRGT